jgi:hypothetical protein
LGVGRKSAGKPDGRATLRVPPVCAVELHAPNPRAMAPNPKFRLVMLMTLPVFMRLMLIVSCILTTKTKFANVAFVYKQLSAVEALFCQDLIVIA